MTEEGRWRLSGLICWSTRGCRPNDTFMESCAQLNGVHSNGLSKSLLMTKPVSYLLQPPVNTVANNNSCLSQLIIVYMIKIDVILGWLKVSVYLDTVPCEEEMRAKSVIVIKITSPVNQGKKDYDTAWARQHYSKTVKSGVSNVLWSWRENV